MLSQQQADGELLQIFSRLVALVLLLLLLAILGFKYFGSVDKVTTRGLQLDNARLLNVLSMVRANWLSQGRPEELMLEWTFSDVSHPSAQSMVKMSPSGWPVPSSYDVEGCKQLWYLLLGSHPTVEQIVTEFEPGGEVCSYIANNSDRLSYQLSSGRVIFLTNY